MEPANDQSKFIYFCLGAIASAAVIFLVLRGGGEETPKTQELASSTDQGEESITLTTPKESAVEGDEAGDEAGDESADEVADEAGKADDNSHVGASRPAPEVQQPPPPSANSPAPPPPGPEAGDDDFDDLLSEAKAAVKEAKYAKGLKLVEKALALRPGDQEALLAATIAACNLKKGTKAKGYYDKIKNSARKNGLKQICSRLGVEEFKVENSDEKSSEDIVDYDQVMREAKEAIKNTQYGKGLKLARQALELKPGDQEALMAATIVSCNLKNGASAKKYFRQIKSAQRRNGLKQICMRLGVPGFKE